MNRFFHSLLQLFCGLISFFYSFLAQVLQIEARGCAFIKDGNIFTFVVSPVPKSDVSRSPGVQSLRAEVAHAQLSSPEDLCYGLKSLFMACRNSPVFLQLDVGNTLRLIQDHFHSNLMLPSPFC